MTLVWATLPVVRDKRDYATPDDRRLAGLADRQHGVVARRQLLIMDYTKDAIHTRLATGRLHPIHRGVYAVGHTRLTARGRWMAAVLACGQDALLSHRDAAALHDLRTVPAGDTHVVAPSRHHIPGIRCHRRCPPLDGTIVDGIPVTTLAQTYLDMAEIVSATRLRELLEEAQRRDKFDLRPIDELLERSSGRHGIPRLQAALADLDEEAPPTRSQVERMFLDLANRYHLPRPKVNVYVCGELVDAYWPEHRLVVEVDGWEIHKTRRAFENDRRRDAKLITAGYRVLRITYRRMRDEPAVVAAQLRALMAAAA